MSKIAKISIILVVALLLAGGIVGLIFALTNKPTPPNDILTERLATPKNIILDQENWILSFSKVDNAERYEIFVNDKSFLTDKTTVSVARFITDCGIYQFQVRALYSIASYNSFKSDTVIGYKYNQLSTPVNLSWGEARVLYWSQVEQAVSYKVLIKYRNEDGEQSTVFKTEDIKYDLNTLLNSTLSNVAFFTIQVQATSEDEEGNRNPYLTDSEYSETKVYYKINAISAPEITLNYLSTEQTSEKMLVWDTDFAVQKYLLFIDGEQVKEFVSDDYGREKQLSVNLTDIITANNVHIGDTLGLHNVYITAVPKTDEGSENTVHNQNSNRIEYTVTHKLRPVDVETIRLSKFGSYLRIEWEHKIDTSVYGISYEATNYIVRVYANANPEIEGSEFSVLPEYGNNSPEICMLNIPLSELQAYGKAFKVQIQSIWQGYEYVYNSDYSDFSAEYSAVTQLDTPDNVVLTEANGVYTLTWRAISSVSDAQTYEVNVYRAVLQDDKIVASTEAVVTQITTLNTMQISTFMNANSSLEAGYYAVTVRACGINMYYVDSPESEPKGFIYKIRLKTPEIKDIERAAGEANDRPVTIVWTYVDNAEKYYFNINGIDSAIVVNQPQYRPEDNLLSETDLLTEYLNRAQQPNQYKITVQAVITDSENTMYINSLQSLAVTFINTYKHATPEELTITQTTGKNKVGLSWTEVNTVKNSSGTYQVFIGKNEDKLVEVNLEDAKLNYIDDISAYLALGANLIRVRCSSGAYYDASDFVQKYYTYNYTLAGSVPVSYSLINSGVEPKIEVTIHASQNNDFRYVTNYYIEFSSGKSISVLSLTDENGVAQAGKDAVFTVDFSYLPLFESTTVTIYAGQIDKTTFQPYINATECKWDSVFLNNLYVETPTISYDEANYIATISISDKAIPYTKQIEWRLTGTTGVNIREYLIDFTSGGTFSINLKDKGYINEGDDMLVGSYQIYALAVSNQSNNLRSLEVSETFKITKPLPNPTNFVQASDNSYLQWDKIANASSYEILLNGSAITPSFSEATVTNGTEIKTVTRLNTADLLNASGTYRFSIKAIADESSYYISNADYTVYEWLFDNQLNAPTVTVVTYNGAKQLAIFYNNLVDNYTIICNEINLNATASAVVTNGYVYYNIESVFNENNTIAGKYNIAVIANPKDAKYKSSNPANVEFVWQKRFDTPVITVSQDFDSDKMIVEWQAISASTLAGTENPEYYQITISTTTGTILVNKEKLTENRYEIAGSILLANNSEYYFVDVCALASENGVMQDSFSNSVKFSYQPRLAKPTITASSQSLKDNEQITISATNLDENANQLDLRVELLNSDGTVADTKIFNNIAWVGGKFTLEGNFHLTTRGIYQISVENVQNKQYATSSWSDYIYIYYAQSFVVAENVSISIDEANNVSVTFDKPDLPVLSNVTGYTLSATFSNGASTDTKTAEITASEMKFAFAGGETWKNALSTKNTQFTFVITALTTEITCAPSNLGLETFNFAPTSSTTHSFVIGAMSDPTDIKFSYDSVSGTISWTGDARFTNSTYVYSLYLYDENGTVALSQENQTTTENYITFDLYKPYAIKFSIQSKNTAESEVVSNVVTKYFANTQELNEISDFANNYYDGAYKASWTNILKNSGAFIGAKYTLTLNGIEFAIDTFDTSGQSVVLTLNDDMIKAIHSNGRNVNWTIKVSDCTYTIEGNTVVIYNGNTSSGSINDAPVIIKDAPTNLRLDGTTASWSAVTFATKYEIYISTTENGTALANRSATTKSTSYDITSLVSGLEAGKYYVVVKVAEDKPNKVFASNDAGSASVEYKHMASAEMVEGLTVTTLTVANDFATNVTWTYRKNNKFSVYLTNSNGDVIVIAENFGVGEKNLAMTDVEDPTKGRYTFSYFDSSANDPTRNLPAGEYILSVVACGYDEYHSNSQMANANYTNKFGLTAVDNANLFAILPDYYISNSEYASDFEQYKNAYGVNTKFFVINDDSLSRATHFNVYVLDTATNEYVWAGKLRNEKIVSENGLTFSAISTADNKVLLSKIVAGANTIKVIPYGDENYYFYIEGSTTFTISEAQDKLASIFTVDLHLMEEAPLLNALSVDVTYSDSPTNTNITEIALVFRNAQIGSTYRVTPYYNSSYDASLTDVACEPFDVTLTASDFSNGIFLGIKVFDKIRHYGPHNYYFTVQTLSRDNNFYLDSEISKTSGTTALKTRLVEFLTYDKNADATKFSLVTEITESNETEALKNGMLTWSLPVHAYSIVVKYTVTMQDKNQSSEIMQQRFHSKQYSAFLVITVDAENNITYAIEQDINNYFSLALDKGVMAFDMRAFFKDTSRIKEDGVQTGVYYLAGTYDYYLVAEALGTNKKVVQNIVFSPLNSYGSAEKMNTYTYQGIPYPNQPKNVNLSHDGVLTWAFSDEIYGEDKAGHFGIVIRNYTTKIIAGTEQEYYEEIIYVDNEYEIDISNYLVAGGKDRNEVFMFTVAPNDYYYNSEYVTVDTSKLDSSSSLPNMYINWDDHREFDAVLASDINNTIYQDISANEYSVWIEVSLLKLSNWQVGDPEPTKGRDYNEVKQNEAFAELVWNKDATSDYFKYITYLRGVTKYNFNLVGEINYLANNLQTSKETWLSADDSLRGGYYYLRVTLKTSSPYYADSSYTAERVVRDVWRSTATGATIQGEYLTTKLTDEVANPNEGADRMWGEAEFKQANLSFYVNTIQEKVDGTTFYRLPKTITVTARLFEGLNYDTNNYYSHTYAIPDPSNFGTQNFYFSSDYPDVMIERCFITGNDIDYTRVKVTIDIHLLFDTNINAGIYHIFWVLNGDEIGDSSPIADPYMLKQEVCHYVILPRPILDYRLDYTGTNNSQFVINWILTPDKYTYTVNESCTYNINLFAFEVENGTDASEKLYNSLSDEEKLHFLDSENQVKYFAENNTTAGKLLDYSQDYFLNGRQCYIQQPTAVNFNLTPNKYYKIYIYLSQKDWMLTGNKNDLYYLNSDTSVGVSYMYKKVSGIHTDVNITNTVTDVWPVENTDMANNAYYTISSVQPDNYNNAFEFWVYNTQDIRASTSRDWMKQQDAEGTYLAHWIIGSKDNAYPTSGGTVDLYILHDYQDRLPNSGALDLTRAVGMLDSNGNIKIDTLTLNELLNSSPVGGESLDKVLVPINYYCRIKTWIDNNSINNNAPLDDSGLYEDDVIYSKKWIRAHIPYVLDENGNVIEEMVDNFYAKLNEKQFTIPYLDMNVLNPSTYFTFRHNIQYAEPTIDFIEILNKDGSSDYVNLDGSRKTDGATDGYVIADSDSGYYYRIWLKNVYTKDVIIRNDKLIEMALGYTHFDTNDGGSSGTGASGNEWVWSDAVRFVIHYIDDTNDPRYGMSYIELAVDSPEAGAGNMFTTLDERLPNLVTFRIQAVTNTDRFTNDGSFDSRGELENGNINNEYLTANYRGEVLSAKSKIDRIYVNSNTHTHNNYLAVKKQYTAPEVTLMFDTMTPTLSYYTENLQMLEQDGKMYKTNVIEGGDYIGLASNPYIYTTLKTLQDNGGQYFEYGMLKTDLRTNYLITLKYVGKDGKTYTKPITLRTYDVNHTCLLASDESVIGGAFYDEVKGKDTDEARFDYTTYEDIYNYITTCLYKAMYDLINDADGTQTATGNYHGGLIAIDIQTIAPDLSGEAVAPEKLWVTSDTRTGYELYFYGRLETVQTTFDQNKCDFKTEFQGGMPSFYTHEGYYYYHHSYIPYNYLSIHRNVNYHIYLDREGNMSYNIYNTRVKSAVTISPGSGLEKDKWNTKNLTEIFKIDLGDPSVDKSNYNQWRLPNNDNDRWHLNIVAVVDDSMEYIGRGFNSKDLYYLVNLKVKNDIETANFNMQSLAHAESGTVDKLDINTLLSQTNGVLTNYSTSRDSSGYNESKRLPYNLAVDSAKVYYYYPYLKTNSAEFTFQGSTGIKDQATRYYDLFSRILNDIFISKPEIRGSDGFKIYIKFYNSKNKYVKESYYTIGLPFNYYRALTFDTSRISFGQSGDTIRMNATYSVNNQFSALKVTINQYGLNNSFYQTQIYSSNSSTSIKSGNVNYYATANFNYAYADCSDSRARSASVINDMIYNYKTAYIGYVQGGNNQFTVTPIHDGYEPAHNLLKPGITFTQKQVNFTVTTHPMSTGIEITTELVGEMEDGHGKILQDEWVWKEGSNDDTVVKKTVYGSYYYKISSIKYGFANMSGATMKATWTYRFDVDESQITRAKKDGFNDEAQQYENMRYADEKGETTEISGIPTKPPKEANYFSLTITTYCKAGFESVFAGGGSWSESKTVTADPLVGKRIEYPESDSIRRYLSVQITGGGLSSGDTSQYVASLGKGGDRGWSVQGQVVSNAPSHLSKFIVNVEVNYTAVYHTYHEEHKEFHFPLLGWEDFPTPHHDYRSKSGTASVKGISGGSSGEFSASGSYYETIRDAWWCSFELDDHRSSGYITSITRA